MSGDSSRPSLEDLRARHPLTVEAFEAMDALPMLGAVADLDQRWAEIERGHHQPEAHKQVDHLPDAMGEWDLIYAGGGLALLHALVMRRRYGYRVVIFDRSEVGLAHREWNVSDVELRALVTLGVFEADEVEEIVAHRHDYGIVRFHAATIEVPPSELRLDGVLDVSLDAAMLLRRVREKLEAAGGDVLDYHDFHHVLASDDGVVVEVGGQDGAVSRLRGRLLVDGMGATSPLTLLRRRGRPFDGVCPTVGSIVSGLEAGSGRGQHDSRIGDILISVAGSQQGKQLIWEGFAGRSDQLTVYLFYYDQVGNRSQRHSLLDLFEAYFALLASYKRPAAAFKHHRPVYGFIPAHHTQRRIPFPLLPGVLPIGDAAAMQSPLTFTGFGSNLRNLDRLTSLLDYALRWDLLEPRPLEAISPYQANVALHWVFSRFMQPWERANDVNQIQNVFARVLNDLGADVAERFFKDQMRWSDYGRIVNHTLAIYPPIIQTALRVLGPRDTLRWIVDYLRFSRAALLAAVGRRLSNMQWYTLLRVVEQGRPAWALLLQSRRSEWRAMGWLDAET